MAEGKRGKIPGQTFTPAWLVRATLDAAGFSGPGLLEGKTLEPAFGDGAFLVEIVERMASEAEAAGLSKEETAALLPELLIGMEKDAETRERALSRLLSTCEKLGLPIGDFPGLELGDFLAERGRFGRKARRVVGNPPYARMKDLDADERRLARECFPWKGEPDLYLAFSEAAVEAMEPWRGKMAFVLPDGVLTTDAAAGFRADHGRWLESVTSFGSARPFPGVSTGAAVVVLDNGKDTWRPTRFVFAEPTLGGAPIGAGARGADGRPQVADGFRAVEERDVYLSRPGAWDVRTREMEKAARNRFSGALLADVADVKNACVTGNDRVFTGPEPDGFRDSDAGVVEFNGAPIERALLRRLVRTKDRGPEAVLFPYAEEGGSFRPMTGKELGARFPLAFAYLAERVVPEDGVEDFRGLEMTAAWSKSQGLSGVPRARIALNRAVPPTGTVKTRIAEAGEPAIGGLTISPKPELHVDADGDFDEASHRAALERIRKAIETEEFADRARAQGKPMSGGYVAVTAPIVAGFRLPEDE